MNVIYTYMRNIMKPIVLYDNKVMYDVLENNIGLLLFLCILMQLHHGGSLLTLKWDGVFNEI